jgi:dihydrodipicolinate synthase/N-acetylneuraminate lyase
MMNVQQAKQLIRGPMVAVATPFKDNYELDVDALRHNVRFMIDHGIVRGRGNLLVAGAGGEFPVLSREERMQVMRVAVEAAKGQVPVMTSTQHTDIRETIALAKYAESVGVEGIQVAPTYYYEPTEDDVVRLFSAVSESIKNIPMMIYNTWWSTPHMTPKLLHRLAAIPNCVSLKWSAPSLGQFYDGLWEFSDTFAIVDNNFGLLISHPLGATAWITHLSGFYPQFTLSIQDALDAGDYKKVAALQKGFKREWLTWRHHVEAYTGGEGAFIKAAMQICGLPAGPVRSPSKSVSKELYEEGRQLLLKWHVPGVK